MRQNEAVIYWLINILYALIYLGHAVTSLKRSFYAKSAGNVFKPKLILYSTARSIYRLKTNHSSVNSAHGRLPTITTAFTTCDSTLVRNHSSVHNAIKLFTGNPILRNTCLCIQACLGTNVKLVRYLWSFLFSFHEIFETYVRKKRPLK